MEGGRILPWNGVPLKAEGMLASYMRPRDGRESLALSVLGPNDLLPLFDPRIVSVNDRGMLICGLECADFHWVVQEWQCTILSLADDAYDPLRYRRKERERP